MRKRWKSSRLATAFDRTVYDRLYLALAIAQSSALITADRKFYATITESPFANHIAWIEEA